MSKTNNNPVGYLEKDNSPVTPEAVTTFREALRLSRSQFSVLFGVTTRCVDLWEAGSRTLSGPARILFNRYVRQYGGVQK